MTEKLDWNLLLNAVRRKDRAREAKDATVEGSDKRPSKIAMFQKRKDP